jgi:hypothetical protein
MMAWEGPDQQGRMGMEQGWEWREEGEIGPPSVHAIVDIIGLVYCQVGRVSIDRKCGEWFSLK